MDWSFLSISHLDEFCSSVLIPRRPVRVAVYRCLLPLFFIDPSHRLGWVGGYLRVKTVIILASWHLIHTAVRDGWWQRDTGDEVGEWSWRAKLEGKLGCKSDSGVRFASQLAKSEQLEISNLIKVGTKVDRQVGPKLGYRETPYSLFLNAGDEFHTCEPHLFGLVR